MAWNNNTAKEWGSLSARALNPSCLSYKPKINSRTVQGESNEDGARIATGGQGGQSATGQATVPDKSWADIAVRGFWKWDTSGLFEM